MTDIEVLSARLEQVVARLEQLSGPVASLTAAVNADGSPGNVAAGELIESAWGNAVSNVVPRYSTLSAGVVAGPGLLFQSGWQSYTTDSQGGFQVPLAQAYPTVNYAVVGWNGDAVVNATVALYTKSVGSFYGWARKPDGTNYAASSFRIMWLAVGPRS